MGKGSRKRGATQPSAQAVEHWAKKGLRQRYDCGKAKPAKPVEAKPAQGLGEGEAERPRERDYGTKELRAKRFEIAGDVRAVFDMSDPIDVLHRGTGRLTDEQALAAHIWRARAALVTGGTGPRLAMLRDLGGNEIEPDDERVKLARDELERIQFAIRREGVFRVCVRVVIGREYPASVYDLQRGLEAAAGALRLHQRR